MTPLLATAGLATGYGRIEVVHDVDLVVPSGVVAALVGPSGAGKSTTLRALSGQVPVVRGEVRLAGERIDGLSPADIAARGLIHVPERGAVFATLTVEDNLRLGMEAARGPAPYEGRRDAVLAAFPQLADLLGRPAGTLSGGEQQMVALGRAFLAEPRVLLLDEISMGLAPKVVTRLYEPIAAMAERGVAMVVVEQHLDRVLRIADVCYVMVGGRVKLVAEPAELRGDAAVAGYLGS